MGTNGRAWQAAAAEGIDIQKWPGRFRPNPQFPIRIPTADPYWELCFGKRRTIEFFDLKKDPDCVEDLAEQPTAQSVIKTLQQQMIQELLSQDDRRMIGHADFYEKIPYVNKSQANFYNRFIQGEKLQAGWVNPGDFEKEKLD